MGSAIPLIRSRGSAARGAGSRLRLHARRLASSALPWLGVILLWYLIPASHLVSPALVPTPVEVVEKFWWLLFNQNLLGNIAASSLRVLAGVALGTALALPIGFLLGWYRSARRYADPLVNFFRALPPIALLPLVIVYFGIGEAAKIVVLFYAAFFTSVIVMYEGIVQISPIYIKVARTLGAADDEIFRRVIIPLALPHALTALRVSLGVAWATLVAAELIAARQGLGAMIENAASFFELDTIYVGIICIGVIALLMDTLLRRIAARLVDWQERVQ